MLGLPKPRDRGTAPVCVVHECSLEIRNEILMQCPHEECEIIAVRNDISRKMALWYVSCKVCNYCYPSPDPTKCIICDEGARVQLEQMVAEARGG